MLGASQVSQLGQLGQAGAALTTGAKLVTGGQHSQDGGFRMRNRSARRGRLLHWLAQPVTNARTSNNSAPDSRMCGRARIMELPPDADSLVSGPTRSSRRMVNSAPQPGGRANLPNGRFASSCPVRHIYVTSAEGSIWGNLADQDELFLGSVPPLQFFSSTFQIDSRSSSQDDSTQR